MFRGSKEEDGTWSWKMIIEIRIRALMILA